MVISSIESWVQLAIWIIAAIIWIARWRTGGAKVPPLVRKYFFSNSTLGVIIALGIGLSAISLWRQLHEKKVPALIANFTAPPPPIIQAIQAPTQSTTTSTRITKQERHQAKVPRTRPTAQPSGIISSGPGGAISVGQQGGITAGTVTVDTPPLNITATLSEERNLPGSAKFAHAKVLTVTPNVQWQPVAFRFLCDQKLREVDVPGVSFGGDQSGISPENPKAGFVYRGSADGAHMPITVYLYSDVALTECETHPVSVTYRK